MTPGELLIDPGQHALNVGRRTCTLVVQNASDRPITGRPEKRREVAGRCLPARGRRLRFDFSRSGQELVSRRAPPPGKLRHQIATDPLDPQRCQARHHRQQQPADHPPLHAGGVAALPP